MNFFKALLSRLAFVFRDHEQALRAEYHRGFQIGYRRGVEDEGWGFVDYDALDEAQHDIDFSGDS